jgi:hypothetical protein
MKLGLDIGRVLISTEPADGKNDSSFIGGSLEAALATPPYRGMFEAVPALVERFNGQVWLVSKCRQRVEDKTRHWLAHHRFFERTGIPNGNLRFCIERHQKAIHCKELGLTHFVDDRLDVLGYLDGVVEHRFLFGPQKPGVAVPPGVVAVADWEAAQQVVR